MGFNKFDDLTKKEGNPSEFYKLAFTKFEEEGKLKKWEIDVHHETFMKIIGTTEPKWQTLKKQVDGTWQKIEG